MTSNSFTKKGIILMIALLSASARSGSAQCGQWSLALRKTGTTVYDYAGGGMSIRQSNGYFVSVLDIKQNGTSFTATAQVDKIGQGGYRHSGEVDGTIRGNTFRMRVFWDYNKTGVYEGSISSVGRVEGIVYNKEDGRSTAVSWHSDGRLDCPPVGAASPPEAAPTPNPKAPSQAGKCTQWDVSGKWSFHQGAEKLHVVLDLQQNGSAITGTGSYTTYDDGSNGVLGYGAKAPSSEERRGTITGTLNGSSLDLKMKWSNGSSGKYHGTIGDDGVPEGTMTASHTPGSYSWRGDKSMKCVTK